jgi:hypothetical protein
MLKTWTWCDKQLSHLTAWQVSMENMENKALSFSLSVGNIVLTNTNLHCKVDNLIAKIHDNSVTIRNTILPKLVKKEGH